MDLEDVAGLNDKEVIARANAQAWREGEEENISLTEVQYQVEEKVGSYDCTFGTSNGTRITIQIQVVEPKTTENQLNQEGIQAFDFYTTVQELQESVALDTDLVRWADAYAWDMEDNSKVEIWDVKYDFDVDEIKEGDYKITFATQGRELKLETTDAIEVGQRIGLSWQPEDIHVMEKMVY